MHPLIKHLVNNNYMSKEQAIECFIEYLSNFPDTPQIIFDHGLIPIAGQWDVLNLMEAKNINYKEACTSLNIWNENIANQVSSNRREQNKSLTHTILSKNIIAIEDLTRIIETFFESEGLKPQAYAEAEITENQIYEKNSGSNDEEKPAKIKDPKIDEGTLIMYQNQFDESSYNKMRDNLSIWVVMTHGNLSTFSKECLANFKTKLIELDTCTAIIGGQMSHKLFITMIGYINKVQKIIENELKSELLENIVQGFKECEYLLDTLWTQRNNLVIVKAEEVSSTEKEKIDKVITIVKNISSNL